MTREQPPAATSSASGSTSEVEDGDHDDGADVVDDGQGQQEELERRLARVGPSSAEDADGEGDVGRHRDAPPPAPRRHRR